MKRLFIGGMVLVVILLAASFLSLIFASADSSWEMGDLARVASRLGVEPRPDGKYELSSVLTAMLDRWSKAGGCISKPTEPENSEKSLAGRSSLFGV